MSMCHPTLLGLFFSYSLKKRSNHQPVRYSFGLKLSNNSGKGSV